MRAERVVADGWDGWPVPGFTMRLDELDELDELDGEKVVPRMNENKGRLRIGRRMNQYSKDDDTLMLDLYLTSPDDTRRCVYNHNKCDVPHTLE